MEIFEKFHSIGSTALGFRAYVYITPDSVSFNRIEVAECDCTGKTEGYLNGTSLDGKFHDGHGDKGWQPVGETEEGKGSKMNNFDLVYQGENFVLKTPYRNGTFDWPIEWRFRVDGGEEKRFVTVHQRYTIDSSGNMTISKGGAITSATVWPWQGY